MRERLNALLSGGQQWGVVLLVFVVASLFAATVVYVIEKDVMRQRRAVVDGVASNHALLIEGHVSQALSATYPLAALVRRGGGSVEGFERLAEEMLPYYPGAACLQLAPGGVVTHVVPLAGNEGAVGHELLVDREHDSEAFLARDSGKLTLAGPFELVQGGVAAVGRLPVYIDGASGAGGFWGFSTVLIRFPEVLGPARLHALVDHGLGYELYRDNPHTGKRQMIARSGDGELAEPLRHTIEVPNAAWTLCVAPVGGWGGRGAWFIARCVVGLLLSFLVALIAGQGVRLREHKDGLEVLVAHRTADLEDEQRRMVHILKNTRSGTWERDLVTGDVRFDEGWAAIVGFTHDELSGDGGEWAGLTHPDDVEQLEEALAHISGAEGDYCECESRVRHKDGRWVWVLDRGKVVERSEDGRAVRLSGTRQDITERKEAEQDKLLLEAELRQSQKMEAVGTLASGVAHDFNNLLTAIYGYLENSREVVPADHPVQQWLEMIEQVSKQGSGVTSSLLTLAHKAPTKKQPVELAGLVRESLRMLRRLLPASVEVEERMPDSAGVWVDADPTQLQQVLMNLAINARDAMSNRGVLSIDLRVECRGEAEGVGRAVLVVEDNGRGMGRETLGRVFEPFFTTKSRGSGTGLGLSVVHGIVTHHGGEISIDSQEGCGTLITVCLPLCDAPVQPLAIEHPVSVIEGGDGVVLLAEDNPYVREVACRALTTKGYRVVTAEDGQEAMREYQENIDSIDMVILDWDMPKETGLSCMKRIKKLRAGVPVILITGNPEFLSSRVFSEKGVSVMAKPFKMSDLVDHVARSLNTGQGAVC